MSRILQLFSLFFLLSFSNAFAQNVGQKPEKNIPAAVETAFKQKFPTKEPIWFSSYRGRYDQKLVFEGRFMFDKRYSAAVYDKEGAMLAFVSTIERKEIPADALKYMADNYPTFDILDAVLVTSAKNEVTFELGIMVDGEYIIKVFSDKGNFIKSTRA